MCGLVGFAWSDLDPDELLKSVAHRGPDGQGGVRIGDVWLGHTRLAIQDLSPASACPFVSGPVTLTYSGEAWNVAELRASLPGPWETTGDTEVIARLLEVEGVAGLDRVDGMFAVAWHDTRTGTWLARDRYGKMPLYLCVVMGGFGGVRWASEIHAAGSDDTRPVAPGTAYNLGTGELVHWAGPVARTAPCSPAEVYTLLRQGVRKRLIADRPVCFLLSGGLDSSLVLSIARDLHPNPVAYTAVFDPASDDLRYAREVADLFGVPLVEVPVPAPDLDTITDAVRAVEVPMKAQVEIALANLPLARRVAADGFRVVLSGEAADELFGGYGGMAIKGASADDAGWRQIREAQVRKMSRGNFMRLNKVFMAAGVEARLPFMERELVEGVLATGKADCPPGKGLLKAAAAGHIPDAVIHRRKDTFQGGSGIADAAAEFIAATCPGLSPVVLYNQIARRELGYLPKG